MDWARRNGSRTTSQGFIEILNFQHFVKHMVFEWTGEKEKTKSIKNWVPVSVVVELECGTCHFSVYIKTIGMFYLHFYSLLY